MERKVRAFFTGTVGRQTDKAVNIGGRWFPKRAIAEQHLTVSGTKTYVLRDWFVNQNPWLIRDGLGNGINKSVKLQDGTLLFQGDSRKLNEQKEAPIVTFETMDYEMDMLVATGVDEKIAYKQIHRKYCGYQKVPGGIQ